MTNEPTNTEDTSAAVVHAQPPVEEQARDAEIDPQGNEAWRVSKSGYSIKQGWGDACFIVAKFPGDPLTPPREEFNRWLDNAEAICKAHNHAAIAKERE